MDATNMEIENLKVAFDIQEDGANILVGHNEASSHWVFDFITSLKGKARWVKDRYRTPVPE